jgi:hydrogenase-4 component B
VTAHAAPYAGALALAAAVGWPILLTGLWLLPGFRRSRAGAPLAATMALPALGLAVAGGAGLELRASGLLTALVFGVDPVGRAFLLLTALLWSVVAVHAVAYTRGDERRGAFIGFLLATGSGNIGLTLAHDAVGFYLFFALMTFAAYGLVVHARTRSALHAGRVYIVMAVIGEGLLLAGMFALLAAAGTTEFAGVPAAYQALARPGVVAALLLLGFGVKAGMLPLHLWLPLAHPVAPTPASALLSGAMIKAGVLGWIRFLPAGDTALPGIGAAVMAAGLAATLYAAAVGVTQQDPKTVLAYSSISQMGFITIGVGAALALPPAAPLLVLAVAVYALHHALAKAALFLAVGIVPPPGAHRHRLFLLAAALPGLVLAGAPLTSGAIAKLALKSGLGELPPPWSVRVDLLLGLAAVGTTLLMARYLAALRRTAAGRASAAPAGPASAAPAGRVSAAPAGHASAGARAHARRHSGTPPGLLLPWATLVVLSLAAAVWLPLATAALGELPLATQTGYLAAALWPLGLGVLLAFVAAALARRYPALSTATVPAGDVVAIIEHGLRAVRRGAASMAGLPAQHGLLRLWQRTARTAGALLDGAAARAQRAMAGPLLGVVLCLLAIALFLALG